MTAERLTRTKVARLLAVSPASVRRMEDKKELHPTLENGVNVFDSVEVDRVAKERARRPVDPTREGERDARGFELLDGGHDLRHLVTTLRISADVAKRIASAWFEVGQRDVVVPRACKVELERCLGRFRDAAELVQRARAAETANEGVNEELMRLQNRLHNLAVFLGELAARTPALAEVLPEVRERLDGELTQVLDRAFECGTAQLVSVPPCAPIAPGAVGESLAELRNTLASAADSEAPAGVAVGPAVEPPGAGASSDATSAPDTSTTKASSVNDESGGRAALRPDAESGNDKPARGKPTDALIPDSDSRDP